MPLVNNHPSLTIILLTLRNFPKLWIFFLPFHDLFGQVVLLKPTAPAEPGLVSLCPSDLHCWDCDRTWEAPESHQIAALINLFKQTGGLSAIPPTSFRKPLKGKVGVGLWKLLFFLSTALEPESFVYVCRVFTWPSAVGGLRGGGEED